MLSLGLVHLHQIVDADSPETRHRLLPRAGDNWQFMYGALKESNRSGNGRYLSEYQSWDNERLARDHAPFAHETDTGPADAWRWAHQNETSASFVYSDEQIALRARGYCMWDRARLDGWAVFQRSWEAPGYPFHGVKQQSRKAEMQMWRERGWNGS
jgi:hypothetical protein